MNKKLEAMVSSTTSEVTTNKLLTASGVDRGAAEIIRDSNGKVIKVIINLPESASAQAAAAIAATPGVADVVVTDIYPGTAGCDGTEASVNALLNEGWTIDSNYNTLSNVTYNNDNSMTVIPSVPNVYNGWRLTSTMGAAVRDPLPLSAEMSVKTSATHGTHTAEFAESTVVNQSVGFRFGIVSQGVDLAFIPYINYFGVNGWTYQPLVMPQGVTPTNLTSYKVVVDDNKLATYTVNGSTVATFQLATGVDIADQCAVFLYTFTGTMEYTLDFWRFAV